MHKILENGDGSALEKAFCDARVTRQRWLTEKR